jgi:hypothetical protein
MIEDDGRSGKDMAQAMTEGARSGSTGTIMNVVLWVLQVAAAAMFLMAGVLETVG